MQTIPQTPTPPFFHQTNYPEARKFIDAGEMISDAVVGDALLEALLGDGQSVGGVTGVTGGGGGEYAGVVVDGFPRTAVQVRVFVSVFVCVCARGEVHCAGGSWAGLGQERGQWLSNPVLKTTAPPPSDRLTF